LACVTIFSSFNCANGASLRFDDGERKLAGDEMGHTLKYVGNDGIPVEAFPLGECEGDCDTDDDCEGSLECYQRDGGESVPGCEGNSRSKTDFCSENILFWSTVRQARAIREGVITSRDLLELMIKQIDAVNPEVNAIITIDLLGARVAADAADAQIAAKEDVGPLHGIPFTVKDAIETEGILSTVGLLEFADYIPSRDAPVVKALKDAGAIVLGKSNVPSGLVDMQTHNELFGTTSNPWDLTRTPGGSSGGAAAAVSTGMSSFDIGTDIGGSIRQPAAFCGVFGHKPSYGIVSALGFVEARGNQVEADIAVIGPLARSAEDLRMLLDLMLRKGVTMEFMGQLPEPPDDIRSLKVAAWLDEGSTALAVDSQVRAVFDTAISNLENAGVPVDRSARPSFDFSLEDIISNSEYLVGAPPTSSHMDWLIQNVRRNMVRSNWAEFFNEYDAILIPIFPTVAFPLDTDIPWEQRVIVDSDGRERPYKNDCDWGLITGMAYLPSTVPPIGLTEDGLPISFQVVGPYGSDYTTIKLAGYIAELNGGYQQPPVS